MGEIPKQGPELSAFFPNTEKGKLSPYQRGGLVIDPAEQNPEVAYTRALAYFSLGGQLMLVGGSGKIDNNLYQDTLASLQSLAVSFPESSLIVFPGHPEQIPQQTQGVSGVITYQDIIGAPEAEPLYPPQLLAQLGQYVEGLGFRTIPTLYLLCGDPNSSVSRASNVPPLDPTNPDNVERVTALIAHYNPKLVYFEGGSGGSHQIPVQFIHNVCTAVSPESLPTIMYSGGIRQPSDLLPLSPYIDATVLGTLFERGTDMSEYNQYWAVLNS